MRRTISGGQTGVDRAALDAALASGLPIGGWVPKGRLAEDGSVPLTYTGMQETSDRGYETRTRWNIRDSDATLVVVGASGRGPGTKLTLKVCEELGKPNWTLWLPVQPLNSDAVRKFLLAHDTVNIAGPRESREPGLQVRARDALVQIFQMVLESQISV